MKKGWQERLKHRVGEHLLLWDTPSLEKYSMDYHHFSPVLLDRLQGKRADCIASPQNSDELEAIISVAAEYEVPLTVRGNGTGNYGQCVPLTGGIVLNLADMDQILEIGDGFMRVEAGARLGKMESEARLRGQELMMIPSTYQTATIGGFLAGGFGGIGSISWGTIWDGFVHSMTVKTVEVNPRTIVVEGDGINPYLHTYGTVGIISEIQISLVPKVPWSQWIVSFPSWEESARFSLEIAEDPSFTKRLVSCHEAFTSVYFKPLQIPEGRSFIFFELDENQEKAFANRVAERNGVVESKVAAYKYHTGLGLSDFSWNHTTLWALKYNPDVTYLQLNYEKHHFIETTQIIKKEFPEFLIHFEFAKMEGSLLVFGIPVVFYKNEERLNQLMGRCEELGISVANAHTWDLEEGGRSYAHARLWDIKRRNDPLSLLNQKKLAISS